MHRFDERRVLQQFHDRMIALEQRAARERTLREAQRSRPRLRRAVARALARLAERLEPALRTSHSHSAPAAERNPRG